MNSPSMSAFSSPSPVRRTAPANGYFLLAFALVLTALAYAATFRFGFVYDDGPLIVLNPTLTSWHSIPSFFLGHYWKFLAPDLPGNYYRPVFLCWLLLNRMVWGLNPAAWHASTLALHLLATTLTFFVARRILRSGLQAGFVAVIFGLHPIHIEAVAWLSDGSDVLMSAFILAAFWAWVQSFATLKQKRWRVLTAALYLLACLTKETALPFPLVAAGYAILFERDMNPLRAALATWYQVVLAFAYLIARAVVLHGLEHPVGVPLLNILLSVPGVFWYYVRLLVWPVGLSAYYDTPPVTAASQLRFLLPFVVLLVVGLAIWRLARHSKVLVFSLLWILTFLAPAIAALPVFFVGEWVHDRYLYLASFGFCLLVGYAIGHLPSRTARFGYPAVQTMLILILAGLMSLGTAWQEQYWANSLLLFVHSVNVAPHNPWAKGFLAAELLRRGDKANARRMYEAALSLDPGNWKNNVAYAIMLYNEGDYRRADALFSRAISGDPRDANAHFDQGLSRFNYGNYSGAENSLREALGRNPELPMAHYWLGYSLEKQGKFDPARCEYMTESLLHPSSKIDAEARLQVLPRESEGRDHSCPANSLSGQK